MRLQAEMDDREAARRADPAKIEAEAKARELAHERKLELLKAGGGSMTKTSTKMPKPPKLPTFDEDRDDMVGTFNALSAMQKRSCGRGISGE